MFAFLATRAIARELGRVIPTTEKLGEDLARPLPLLIRLIGAVLDNPFVLHWFNPWDVSNPDKLLRKGVVHAGKKP